MKSKKNNLTTGIIMNSVESDIYRVIDSSFDWLKNDIALSNCDEVTMKQWYDFLKWCYSKNALAFSEEAADYELEKNADFDISPLMEKVLNEVGSNWAKYNISHQEISQELYKDNGCDCDDEDNYDCECISDGFHLEYYEDAFHKISDSVDTSTFKKLSTIL